MFWYNPSILFFSYEIHKCVEKYQKIRYYYIGIVLEKIGWMHMNKYRIVTIAIIICLLVGNSAYALVQGERQAHLYTSNNEMNYEKPVDEMVVADNDTETIQPNTEFTTEKPQTTEQSTEKTTEKSEGKKKKSSKKSDKDGTKPGDETENGGDETVPTTKKLESLEYTWTDCNSLLYGKDLDPSNIYVTAVYDNGDRENVAIENCSIVGFNSKKLGAGNCTISYYGVSVQASYTILNYETSIFCAAWDKRNQYRYGDVFSKTDLAVSANMADGTVQELDAEDYSVNDVDTKKLGENQCTIQYKDFTITENYQVHNYAVELESTINRFVVRGDVEWWEIVSDDTVTVTMADGTKNVLSPEEYEVQGYSTKKRGGYTVTLKYEDVTLEIPYQVYYDILQIDLGEEQDAVQRLFFTEDLTVSELSDFGMEETYVSQKDGKTYRLAGAYLDQDYEKPVEYPMTFVVKKGYRINRSSMQWHNHYIYLQYEEVPEPIESPEDEENEEGNAGLWLRIQQFKNYLMKSQK